MKELPYFKFFPAEWVKGDITLCSMKAQGLFINICSFYWMKGCNMSLTGVQQRFNGCSTELQELLDNEILVDNDDEIAINFLDDQFEQFSELIKQKIRAGKASAKIRKVNRRSTRVEHDPNNKDKIRKDKDKEKIKSFRPPTLDEVKKYCKERENNVDANRWHNFYSAKGWMIGKSKMKDWRAAVRTWEEKNTTGNVYKKTKHPEAIDPNKIILSGEQMPESLKRKFGIK